PAGIKFNRIPEDKSQASMLVNRELDAATVGRAFRREWNLIDRSTTIRASEGDWSKVKPLFANPMEEAKRFVRAHGYIPANHAYIIRGDIYEQYPWVAFNLYKAFLESKRVYQEKFPDSIPSGLIMGREYMKMTREIFGDDPYPYGVKANQDMLQTIVDYSFEQGLTKQKLEVNDLFAPSTRDL